VSSRALPELAEAAQAMPLYTTAGEAGFITGRTLAWPSLCAKGEEKLLLRPFPPSLLISPASSCVLACRHRRDNGCHDPAGELF